MNSEEFAENANGLCAATLCADSETVDAVKQAVGRKNGTFAGELEDYACDTAIPRLVQKLQRAEICVCVIDFDRDREAAVGAANALQQTLHGRGSLIAVTPPQTQR